MTKEQALTILKSACLGLPECPILLREAIRIVSNASLTPPQN